MWLIPNGESFKLFLHGVERQPSEKVHGYPLVVFPPDEWAKEARKGGMIPSAARLPDVEKARQEIIQDLKSPEFVKLAWDTAKEFQQAIFPVPKLTSEMLRAQRLAWMQ